MNADVSTEKKKYPKDTVPFLTVLDLLLCSWFDEKADFMLYITETMVFCG